MADSITITSPQPGNVPPVLVVTGTVTPVGQARGALVTVTGVAPSTRLLSQIVYADAQGNWTCNFGLDPNDFPNGAFLKAQLVEQVSNSFLITVGE